MGKTILITGATSGIGLETAKCLAAEGHDVIIHGRSASRTDAAKAQIDAHASKHESSTEVATFLADLSTMSGVASLASAIIDSGVQIDVLINNAGVLKTSNGRTPDGLDVRFAVNTFAPVLLTDRIADALAINARIINLSSAAQAPVNIDALEGRAQIDEQFEAYAQSKLALTMWNADMAADPKNSAHTFLAINPGSLLATAMVNDGFGIAGKDVQIGVDILMRATLSEEFEGQSGRYFDNDRGTFANPHADGLDEERRATVVKSILGTLERIGYGLSR